MKNPTITLEMLKAQGACAPGIAYYEAHWTEAPTLSVCLQQLVDDGRPAWAEWMLCFSPPAWRQYEEATAKAMRQIIAAVEKGD